MSSMSASMMDASTTRDPPPPYCLTESVHGRYNLHGSVVLSSSHTMIKGSHDAPRTPLSTEDWMKQQKRIHHLYIEKDLILREVKKEMKLRYGFDATYVMRSWCSRPSFLTFSLHRLRMYKSRLATWGYSKKCDQREMASSSLDDGSTGKNRI